MIISLNHNIATLSTSLDTGSLPPGSLNYHRVVVDVVSRECGPGTGQAKSSKTEPVSFSHTQSDTNFSAAQEPELKSNLFSTTSRLLFPTIERVEISAVKRITRITHQHGGANAKVQTGNPTGRIYLVPNLPLRGFLCRIEGMRMGE